MNNIARDIFIDVMNSINVSQDKYNDIICKSSGTLSILHYPEIIMNKFHKVFLT